MADNKFTYAAIFCGVGFICGASLTNAPRIYQVVRTRSKGTDVEGSNGHSEKDKEEAAPAIPGSRRSSRTVADTDAPAP